MDPIDASRRSDDGETPPVPRGRTSWRLPAASEPFVDPARRLAALRLGMGVFLASLAVLFGSTALAFLVVRFSPEGARQWRGIALPWELVLSTALLVASSIACESGLRAIRAGDRGILVLRLRQCVGLALAFIVVQAWCWSGLLRGVDVISAFRGDAEAAPLVAAWMFVVLTALHAAHVVGGLLPMMSIARRAKEGRYTAAAHDGVLLLRNYWHFLGAIWLAIILLLVATMPAWGGGTGPT
ncbi:MAG TPA: cytochrome c oxidase subunit 3 [Phycisphaerales bacterium]|nr:cytochrome c oxidase subunit 3 [Phycisphaerales bacterium]HMP36026.1 cytochrome c oxidase subunit 3 [Phycisphaerales bacterium]